MENRILLITANAQVEAKALIRFLGIPPVSETVVRQVIAMTCYGVEVKEIYHWLYKLHNVSQISMYQF